MGKYILGIDQSTQGTKGLLFDDNGILVARADQLHRQIINEKGWVEHDPEEILDHTLLVCREVAQKAGIDKKEIVAIGISNQRETAMAWDRESGKPIYHAIVWQCARGVAICDKLTDQADKVKAKTGLNLSPYFSAAKLGWIMENVPQAEKLAKKNQLCCGTMDSWLLYNLTKEKSFKTDYSNASRTQLFHLFRLGWDEELCKMFGVPRSSLAEVCMSDSCFGHTDLAGWLDRPIPIHGVLGDSHGALFGQDCRKPGMTKCTYGTGSSVMMLIGDKPKFSNHGLATSLAWGMDGKAEYVLEGNINYTGAVITWLKKEMGLIRNDAEATELALQANPSDRSYFVPAFTGLGAPHFDSKAAGLFTGITRTTGRKEFARAALDCIVYQITDLVNLMRVESGASLKELRADGGPTASSYLMQFQSDMTGTTVQIPDLQELSGMGAAYTAGIAVGIYSKDTIFRHVKRKMFSPVMEKERRERLYEGWKHALRQTLYHQ